MEYNTAVWTIIISIGLFFLLREVFCWYYKINDIKKIMEEQRDLLKTIVEKENKNPGEKKSSNTESYPEGHPLKQ